LTRFPSDSYQPWNWGNDTFEHLSDLLQPFNSEHYFVAQGPSEQTLSHDVFTIQDFAGLDNALMQPPHISMEASRNDPHSSRASIMDMDATHSEEQSQMNRLTQAAHAEDRQHTTQRVQSMATPITRAMTGQTVQNMTMPHTSLAPDIPARTLQNVEERWTCDREGCERLTFKTQGAWQ
jgi:hypothetical protein